MLATLKRHKLAGVAMTLRTARRNQQDRQKADRLAPGLA